MFVSREFACALEEVIFWELGGCVDAAADWAGSAEMPGIYIFLTF